MTIGFTQTCKDLEHFETPEWAAKAILRKEILTSLVIDPCCGIGILADAALSEGYKDVFAWDIYDWGYERQCAVSDFLVDGDGSEIEEEFTIFMNPPFSLACQFVERSFEIGARKVICFQRFAWWESARRRDFWEKFPPNRVYICADRADCWRHDIPKDLRGSGTPTAHAWFVWESGHPPGTLLGHVSKKDLRA